MSTTSVQALKSVKLTPLHNTILAALRELKMATSPEIDGRIAPDFKSHKRMAELVRMGEIEVVLNDGVPHTRRAPSGRQATVYQIAT